MGDKLVEINRTELPLLRMLYTRDSNDLDESTKSRLTCMAIDEYISCFEQDPDVAHIKFFCLNGNILNGTFVVVVSFTVDNQ